MTAIKLWNTATKSKAALRPLDTKNVRMYVCGPTVYDRAHIGNARPVVVFDVLYRLLRHEYGADAVTYVRNFTDVDDKINARSVESGRDIRSITDETIQWYLEDMDALGALRPTHMPRCTEYIAPMVAMSAALIARGNAYAADGHVLFDVTTYHRYGKLSNRALVDMIAGARVEVAPYKRNPMDFVLWKPSDATQPGWDSPWGRGRPGWHIECSAMAKELLGEHFDIHAGGIDLLFPHHENELAQSNCLHGGEMASVWMHNGFLEVAGQKMSKSLGNFFTVRDLLEKGWPGEVIRFVLLSSHYRKPLDWTVEKAVEAEARLHGFIELVARYGDIAAARSQPPDEAVVNALADDLNTHEALGLLLRWNGAHEATRLARAVEFLGLLSWEQIEARTAEYNAVLALLNQLAAKLQEMRLQAVLTKDFTKVDLFKNRLSAANVSVMMTKAGVTLRPEMNVSMSRLESLT